MGERFVKEETRVSKELIKAEPKKRSVGKMAVFGVLVGLAYWLIPDFIPTWIDDAVVGVVSTVAFPLITALRNRKTDANIAP